MDRYYAVRVSGVVFGQDFKLSKHVNTDTEPWEDRQFIVMFNLFPVEFHFCERITYVRTL